MEVYKNIKEAFMGPGIGFENDLITHFTLNADINAGFSSIGTAIEFKPVIQYYFQPNNNGFYIGPSFKYTRLIEKNNANKDVNNYDDDLYQCE